MQLCHIHFYQKIARKKVARVNAALELQPRLKYWMYNEALILKFALNKILIWKIRMQTVESSKLSLKYSKTSNSELTERR